VRNRIREHHRDFDLSHALDEMRRKLDELLDLERDTLAERKPGNPDLAAKEAFLDQLPHGLSEALTKLKDYAFEDEQAAGEFANLLEELENIQRLEEFMKKHGESFHGP